MALSVDIARGLRGMAVMLVLLLALCAPVVSAAPESPEDGSRDFIAGRAALEDGLYEQAQRKFEHFIASCFFDNKKALGTLYLLQAMHAQAHYEEALQTLEKHEAWVAGSKWEGEIQYWKARCLLDAGHPEQALAILERYDVRFTESRYMAPSVRLRALAQVKAGQGEAASSSFSEYARRFAGTPAAADNLMDWAQLQLSQSNPPAARTTLERLVTEYPDASVSDQARVRLAELLSQDPDSRSRAVVVLQELTARDGVSADNRFDAWLRLGALAAESGDFGAAWPLATQAMALARSPAQYMKAGLFQSRLESRSGSVTGAIHRLQGLIEAQRASPDRAAALLLLADLQYATSNHLAALANYQMVLEGASQPAELSAALMGKAWSLAALGRYAEAAPVFDKAAIAFSNAPSLSATAIEKGAESYLAASQPAVAREHWGRLITLQPSSPQMPRWRLQMAECDLRQGDLAAAEVTLRAIVEQSPEHPLAQEALLRLADTLQVKGRPEEAIRAYDDFPLQFPKSPRLAEALLGRGKAYYRAGHFGAALADFTRLAQDYTNALEVEQAEFLRGRAVAMTGDVAHARRIAEEFLTKYPESPWVPEVLFGASELAFNTADFEYAQSNFLRVATRYPSSEWADDAWYWAGRSAAARKELKDAADCFKQLSLTYTNSPLLCEARLAQGDAFSLLGDWSGAILAFEEVIKRCPDALIALRAAGRKGDSLMMRADQLPELYQDAYATFRKIYENEAAPPALRMQAEYKAGNCLQLMKQYGEAIERYTDVVYEWLALRESGRELDSIWLKRAAIRAADLLMREEIDRPEEAIRICRRVVDAGVPGAQELEARIAEIQSSMKKS